MVIEDMMSNNVKFESPLHIGNLENNRELCIKPPRDKVKEKQLLAKTCFHDVNENVASK